MKLFKIFLLALFAIFLLAIGYFYENKVSFTHFVDEEENVVTAKYMLGGEKFYGSIFSQHQPVAYIASEGIQKFVTSDSIFVLIKRHREFMIAWSMLWAVFLVWRFGLWEIPAVLTIEISKIFLLGNLFLAESLSIYPIIYLTGIIFTEEKIKKFEKFFIGIIFGLLIFLLSPIWPLLAGIGVVLIFQKRKEIKKFIAPVLLGFLTVFLAVSFFVSWPGYFKDAIVFNSKYYIPLNGDQLSIYTIPKSFFSFVLAITDNSFNTPILGIIKGVSIFYIFGLIVLISKKYWKLALITFFLLGFSNIRFITPGMDYYRGFHLIIWFSILISSTVYIFYFISKKIGNYLPLFLVSIPIFIIAFVFSRKTLFVKRNVLNDYYINYSAYVDAGSVIAQLKRPGDTLFVVPDDSLIYWQSGIARFSPYVVYYQYMNNVPYVVQDLQKRFENNPPAFFYCRCEGDPDMQNYLKNYTPILKDKKNIWLYILKTRIEPLTGEQKAYFDYYRYSFPVK